MAEKRLCFAKANMLYWYHPKLQVKGDLFRKKIRERFFFCEKQEAAGMEKKNKKIKASAVIYWTLTGIVCALLVSVQPVMAAETVWDRFSTIVRDFYAQILAISTIVAVTVAAVALIVRMVSRNQKAVDEATAWLKRIVITWILLNSLGLIVAYIQPLIAGGNYTG